MAYREQEYQKELIRRDELNIGNRSMRIPVWFCIDVSGRMDLKTVEAELRKLLNKICAQSSLRVSVELAIYSFSDTVQQLCPLRCADTIELVTIERRPSEQICLSELLQTVVRDVEKQRRLYAARDTDFSRPTVILFASEAHEQTLSAKMEDMLRLCDAKGTLTLLPISDKEDDKLLRQLSATGRVYTVADNGITAIFDRISLSIEALSASSSDAYSSLLSAGKDW